MAGVKTTENDADAAAFLAAIPDARRRADALRVAEILQEVTGERPRMWGTAIVGFGRYSYVNRDGTLASWPLAGLSPRTAALTVYTMSGFDGMDDLLTRLGPHTKSVSCLYLKNLDQNDLKALREIAARSVAAMKARYRS